MIGQRGYLLRSDSFLRSKYSTLVIDYLTGHTQDDVWWCILFVADIVLIDELD